MQREKYEGGVSTSDYLVFCFVLCCLYCLYCLYCTRQPLMTVGVIHRLSAQTPQTNPKVHCPSFATTDAAAAPMHFIPGRPGLPAIRFKKIKVTICNHQADNPLFVWPDV